MRAARLESLLAAVPDEPALIDTRGLLLESPATFGDGAGFVAVRDGGALLAAFGDPPERCFERALELAAPGAELVATGAAVAAARRQLAREGERAFIHTLGAAGARRDDRWPEGELLAAAATVAQFPEEIRREIEQVRGHRPVGVSVVDGRPVSICYPVLTTERWWDVSIETLPGFRRQGRAAAAFLRLERAMRPTGLAPAWGAVESNTASLALAAKLGFERVAELYLFSGLGTR